MKTFIKTLLLLLPLALFAKDATIEQLFSVQTLKVQKVTTAHSKKNYGYVRVDEARVNDISPRFGGYVVKLYANKIYKKVKKGEALASVYSPEVFKAKDEYLNSYNYAKKHSNKGMLRSAKLKLELLGVSQSEIKKIISAGKVSLNTTIYSPIDGYIYVKNINKGSAFNAKSKLFEIVNLDEVWVEAKIFEDDRVWLSEAKKYDVHFKSTKNIYTTTNILLYPKLNQKEATMTLRLRLKNKNNFLFPGMYATINSKSQTNEYLTLPSTAVIRKNSKHYAFMVGEFKGEYEPIEISVEHLDNQTYIIKAGLNEGDEVVNNALFMMDSDAQINTLY